jgi:hypothetical protein
VGISLNQGSLFAAGSSWKTLAFHLDAIYNGQTLDSKRIKYQ